MADEPNDPHSQDLFAEDEWARRVAYDLVREAADADDVVQDLWLDVLKKAPTEIKSPRAWIRGAVKNIVQMKHRSSGRRRRHEDAAASQLNESVDPAAQREARDLVAQTLEHLRSPYRETIELRYLEGLEPSEIAQKLGLPSDTIRTRLARGLEQMRASLRTKSGKDGARWPMLLLPLLRGHGEGDVVRRVPRSRRTAGLSIFESLLGRKKKLAAGIAACACLLLFVFYPRTSDLPPKTERSGALEVGPTAATPNPDATAIVADQGPSDDRRSTAARPSGGSSSPPLETHAISFEVQIIDGGAAADAEIVVEAARAGDFSFSIPSRRPLRLTPEESIPFEPIVRVQGRSGRRMPIPVPTTGTYRLRITTEIAQNAVYASMAPGIDGTSIINLVRDPHVSIFGISDDTPVTIRRDECAVEPSIAMQPDDGEDEEFRRAKGSFLLPIRIDVGLDGVPLKATTRVLAQAATIRLPEMIPLECAVLSAIDDRPIAGAASRSSVFGVDGTQWSIEAKSSVTGRATLVVPRVGPRPIASFAQLRAPGFAMIDMQSPVRAKTERDWAEPAQVNSPLVVRMLPDDKTGGGRIIDSDGNPVRKGNVFYLAGETSPLVGCLDSNGRFRFEPIMNSRISHDSAYEFRAQAPFKQGTISLLFDDEESRMHHFTNASADEILRGEWIGRLPSGDAKTIEFIDKSTRAPVHPEDLFIVPLDMERRTLGFELFRKFSGRRWPMAGMWAVDARSSRHEPLVVTIDADRAVPAIELTPRKSNSIEIDVRFDGVPRPFQAFSFFAMNGTKLNDGPAQADSKGRFVIVSADLGRSCTYRVEGNDVLPSIHAPTLLEIGGKYTIDLRRAVAVPIAVVDANDRPIDAAAVVVRRSDGALGRGDSPLIENGNVLLTDEAQQLVVAAPGFRPQGISWALGPLGEISPLRVVLTPGNLVRFRLDKRIEDDIPIVIDVIMLEMFDAGTPAPLPPNWLTRTRPRIDDWNVREFQATPGRYRLRIRHGALEVENKVFEVRDDLDLGTIVIDR